MVWLAIVIAFYLAWNLGANDVANSMGTSVGSQALTLRRAIVIAGIFELVGALLFGHGVSQRLVTGVIDLQYFVAQPQVFIQAMLAVLCATGIWLNVATVFGLPVSSSHATVGALAGVGIVAIDGRAVHWPILGMISLTWLVTPLVSGGLAMLLCPLLGRLRNGSIQQLQEWLPWLAAVIVLIFGVLVLPSVSDRLSDLLSTNFIHGAVSHRALTLSLGGVLWFGLIHWLLRAADNSPVDLTVESIFIRLQIISACFVAFAHGSNDVGNAIAPLAAIVQTQATAHVPMDKLTVPFWVLGVGGVGLVCGLAVLGQRVIRTIGEGLITLRPSGGFAAELATAMTILLASRWGLPISTSHALVGGVVGVGLASAVPIRLDTVKSIGVTWVATVPLAAVIAAIVFHFFSLLT